MRASRAWLRLRRQTAKACEPRRGNGETLASNGAESDLVFRFKIIGALAPSSPLRFGTLYFSSLIFPVLQSHELGCNGINEAQA